MRRNKQEREAVLKLLGTWSRLLSVDQVASLLQDRKDPKRAAQRLLGKLEAEGLVSTRRIVAHAPVQAAPLAVFSLGDDPPDFVNLSARCRERWKDAAGMITVAQLTAAAAASLGVPRPRTVRTSENAHDLQMAEVALSFWRSGQVVRWLRDDVLTKEGRWGGVVPDAEVWLRGGARFVVECGGTYSAKKLATFHGSVVASMEGLGVDGYRIY